MDRHLPTTFLSLALILLASPCLAQDEGDKNPRRVGRFPFVAVVDGDTVRVEMDGRISSLRLLAIDTEETFHDDNRRLRMAKMDFKEYVASQQGNRPRPVKYPTPFGEAAKVFAEKFFAGVKHVEIENDDPKEKTGHYGRLLSYVFVVKDGKRIHYNVEVVRQGFSPYYTKYGRSRSYEKDFLAAEKEARDARRGIWGDWQKNKCYPDYAKRLKWWADRAELINRWRQRVAKNATIPAEQRPVLIQLDANDGPTRLQQSVGKKVVVFASIDRIRHPVGRGSIIVMSAKRERFDAYFDRRLHDGGQYNREMAIIEGVVQGEGNRVSLGKARLIAPKIKDVEVPANEKPVRRPAKPRPERPNSSRNQSGRIRFHYEGTIGKAFEALTRKHGANLAIGPLTKQQLSTFVRGHFNSIYPGEAAAALAQAAGFVTQRTGRDVYAIKAPPKQNRALVQAEQAVKLGLLEAERAATSRIDSLNRTGMDSDERNKLINAQIEIIERLRKLRNTPRKF